MENKPKILFVLGYPRSGSTVFGEVVGQVKGLTHVGEMERLFYPRKNKAAYRPQKECSCDKQLYDCEFWKPYFDDLENYLKTQNSELDWEVNTKSLCEVKEDLIQKGNFTHEKSKFYGQVIEHLCSKFCVSTDNIILDTSKELWYAKFLENTGKFDISYIHLVRDVKGVVYSRQKKLKKINSKTGKVSLNYKYLIYDTLRWNKVNSEMNSFLKDKKSLQIVYNEFVERPNEIIKKVAGFAGIGFMGNIVNSDNEFEIMENHLIHGNRFRFERGLIKLRPDLRWKEELKERDKKLINLISWFKPKTA